VPSVYGAIAAMPRVCLYLSPATLRLELNAHGDRDIVLIENSCHSLVNKKSVLADSDGLPRQAHFIRQCDVARVGR